MQPPAEIMPMTAGDRGAAGEGAGRREEEAVAESVAVADRVLLLEADGEAVAEPVWEGVGDLVGVKLGEALGVETAVLLILAPALHVALGE